MEKTSMVNESKKAVRENSDWMLFPEEAKGLYAIYEKNKWAALIYYKEQVTAIKKHIWWKWDILKFSDWEKIKEIAEKVESKIEKVEPTIEKVEPTIEKVETTISDKIENLLLVNWKLSQENAKSIFDLINRKWRKNIIISLDLLMKLVETFTPQYSSIYKRNYLKYIGPSLEKSIKTIAEQNPNSIKEENNSSRNDSQKRYLEYKNKRSETKKDLDTINTQLRQNLVNVLTDSIDLKENCYNFIYKIAKWLKNESNLLRNFIEYNRIYNSKVNWYKWSITQFLRLETDYRLDLTNIESEYKKRIEINKKDLLFKWFIYELRRAPEESTFIFSMNTKKEKGKKNYEHAGFIIKEEGKLFITHWKTSKDLEAKWIEKIEITEGLWYFDSSIIRKRFKNWFFNLERII
jgi:hypothetical protein